MSYIFLLTGLLPGVSSSAEVVAAGTLSGRFEFSKVIHEGFAISFSVASPSVVYVDTNQRDGDATSYQGTNAVLLALPSEVPASPAFVSLNGKFACYEPVMPGSYSLAVIGEGRISVNVFSIQDLDALEGYDFASAVDLGEFGSSFAVSHQKDPSIFAVSSHYGDIGGDVFYRFRLSQPMDVAAYHWGSPVTASLTPGNAVYGSRIYILRRVSHSGGDHYSLDLAYDSFSGGTITVQDPVHFPEQTLGCSMDASILCRLEEGEYYLISECPFKRGNATEIAYDGPLRTTIRGFLPEGISATAPIVADIDDSADFQYVDSRNSQAYTDYSIHYLFTTTVEQDVTVLSSGTISYPAQAVHTASGDSLSLTSLPPGVHSLIVTGNGGDVTAEISNATFSRKGNTPANPEEINLPGIFRKRLSAKYYPLGSYFARLSVGSDMIAVFDLGGTGGTSELSIVDQNANPVPVSRPYGCRNYTASLVPGTYMLSVQFPPGTRILDLTVRSGIDRAGYTPLIRPLGVAQGRNSIVSYYPTSSGVTSPGDGSGQVEVQYYDGLGRETQKISVAASTYGEDEVSLTEYSRGRTSASWLPAAVSPGGGGFVDKSRVSRSSEIEYGGDSGTFSLTEYENNLLSRISSTVGPGAGWHALSRGKSRQYLVNTDEGELSCRRFAVSDSASVLRRPALHGFYPAGSLTVTAETDENNCRRLIFIDGFGQRVLDRRVEGNGGYSDTYYVYDNNFLLSCVIPPEASAIAGTEGSLRAEVFIDYCWAWAYDSRRRCSSVHAPGGIITRTIYSRSGHPVFTQTAVQRSRGEWICDLPDTLGRSAVTMVVDDSEWIRNYDGELSVTAVFNPNSENACLYDWNAPIHVRQLLSVRWYDSYAWIPALRGTQSSLQFSNSADCEPARTTQGAGPNSVKGLLTGKLSFMADGGDNTGYAASLWYNHRGLLTQRRQENTLGGLSVTNTRYDFQGRILSSTQSNSDGNGASHSIKNVYSLDRSGRISEYSVIADADSLLQVRNGYDDLGRKELCEITCPAGRKLEAYDHNVRGLLTAKAGGEFSQALRYNAPSLPHSHPRWDGTISETSWSNGTGTNTYSFSYDSLSHLTGADYANSASLQVNRDTERNITYSKGGNILSLKRYVGADSTSMAFQYAGNRLERVISNGITYGTYQYDADGNMIFDPLNGLSLTRNRFGWTTSVERGTDTLARYGYLSDGEMVSALDGNGHGLLYLGAMTFRKDSGGISLESIAWDGGRIIPYTDLSGHTKLKPLLYFIDYLGSVRAVTDGITGAVLERSDYLPYGTRLNRSASGSGTGLPANTLRFHYNGKEDQAALGVPLSNYGARMYDASTASWNSPEPEAQDYLHLSPYAFCAGNPVNLIDPDGKHTRVAVNPDGTYRVVGGALDKDLNVYIYTQDANGEYTVRGPSIGKTVTEYSFYNSDKAGNDAQKWQMEAIIDPLDRSGTVFLQTHIAANYPLGEYMLLGRSKELLDFKTTNGVAYDASLDIYRGMLIPSNLTGGPNLFASARDVGNIMAGYYAGANFLPWPVARLGFDAYQGGREGDTTQEAQLYGWRIGWSLTPFTKSVNIIRSMYYDYSLPDRVLLLNLFISSSTNRHIHHSK